MCAKQLLKRYTNHAVEDTMFIVRQDNVISEQVTVVLMTYWKPRILSSVFKD